MAAYLIAEIDVTDPRAYEAYRRDVPGVIAAHGGRYLARGGAAEVLEGSPSNGRHVILEFPDMDHLSAFYRSADYAALKAVRGRASVARVIAVDGID